jgi:hypothetical protein
MVQERNHEYLAVGIRQQIESLTHMIEDVKQEQMDPEALEWRLKAVELSLRRLRLAA